MVPGAPLRWAKDYGLIALLWAATAAAPEDPRGFATGWRRDVLLIPGVSENWQFLRPLVNQVHDAGHPVHVLPQLEFTRGSIEAAAALVLDHVHRNGLDGVALLAHSKGGLIGKLAMSRDVAGQIDRMVALATPWLGSTRADLLPLPHLRSLGPRAPLIATLSAQREPNASITSIYGTWDEHVPLGSELPGATNVMLPVEGHARITTHPAAVAAVLEALREA